MDLRAYEKPFAIEQEVESQSEVQSETPPDIPPTPSLPIPSYPVLAVSNSPLRSAYNRYSVFSPYSVLQFIRLSADAFAPEKGSTLSAGFDLRTPTAFSIAGKIFIFF